MKFYSAPRLSCQSLSEGPPPWEFEPVAIPTWVRTDKKLREAWINNPKTVHNCYTFNQGLNPLQRISSTDREGNGNPIRSIDMLVADYDAVQTVEKAIQYANEFAVRPNILEHTLSGHWRWIWGLDEPILMVNNSFHTHFKKQFAAIAFDPARGMPGFDKPAWESANRLWTNGCEWHFIHDVSIAADVTRGWLIQASKNFKFGARETGGPQIPLDIVREKLADKYPRFKSWDTDFLENSMGPTFWVDGSTSPKSAVVRLTGLQTFSAHAAKAFYTWTDLLGYAFVQNFESEKLGRAIRDIHYDGKLYWVKTPNGIWKPFNRENMLLELKTTRKLSARGVGGEPSQIEAALSHVNNYQTIDGAGDCVFMPEGIYQHNGAPHLNICSTRVMAPSAEPGIWGPDGNFPFVSQVHAMIPSDEPFERILSYLAWAYQHAYKQEPAAGQALFLCGPTGVGKTLWAQQIVGSIFGGYADAAAFLTGDDAGFNEELWNKGIFNVDDGTPSSNLDRRMLFSHIVKRMTSNDTHRRNGKFLKASFVIWLGRIIVTLNMNRRDARMFPDLSISNQEKVMFIRTTDEPPIPHFPERPEIKAILSRELPYFCRYLLDYKIPERARGENRYGIKSYHDKTLVKMADESNSMDVYRQIVEMWFPMWLASNAPATEWTGTALELFKEVNFYPDLERMCRKFDVFGALNRMEFLVHVGLAEPVPGSETLFTIATKS